MKCFDQSDGFPGLALGTLRFWPCSGYCKFVAVVEKPWRPIYGAEAEEQIRYVISSIDVRVLADYSLRKFMEEIAEATRLRLYI